MGLHKMVSEFLIWRLGEHCLFPEVRGEITVGLGNGIKSGLGEVAQRGSAAPGRSVAVVDAGHHQQLLGHRGGDDASASGGRDEAHQHGATAASHLGRGRDVRGQDRRESTPQQALLCMRIQPTLQGTVWGLPILFPQ